MLLGKRESICDVRKDIRILPGPGEYRVPSDFGMTPDFKKIIVK